MTKLTHKTRRGDKLFDGYAGRLLVLVATCSLLAVGGRALFAPLLPAIINDLGITPSGAGFALTVMTALSAVFRYPGGRLADQLSRKTIIAVAIGSMMAGFSVLTVSVTYAMFFLGTIAVGIGAGLYLPSAFALLSDQYVGRRGQAIGVNNAAINLGGILAAGLAIAVLAMASWRTAFVPVVLFFGVLLALMHRWNDESYVISHISLDPRSTVRRLLSRPRIRWMVVSAAFVMFVQRGSIAFVPLFLQAEKGFSPTLAGGVYAGIYLVGMVTTPMTGWIGDRIGHASVAFQTVLVGMVGLIVAVLGDGTLSVVSGILVFAFGIIGYWPAMNAYVLSLFPDDSMGGDFGALGTMYLGVGSLGPAFVGTVAEQSTYLLAFACLPPCLLASAGISAWLSVRS